MTAGVRFDRPVSVMESQDTWRMAMTMRGQGGDFGRDRVMTVGAARLTDRPTQSMREERDVRV